MNSRALLFFLLWFSASPAFAANKLPTGDVLVVLSVDTGEARALVRLPGLHCEHPRWSPDGKWIAFSTVSFPESDFVDATSRKIMVVPARGGKPTSLADGGHPAWSPDGSMLAWHRADNTFHYAVSVSIGDFDPHKVRVKGIETVSSGHSPMWRSDSELYLCKPAFVALDLAINKQSQIYWPQIGERTPYGVSPDGNRVVYSNWVDDFTLRISESRPFIEPPIIPFNKVVTKGQSYGADWSTDGSQIVASWRAKKDQPYQIVTLAPSGKDQPKLVAGQNPDRWNIEPAWSPDGKSIVYRSVRMNVGPYLLGEEKYGPDR